MSRFFQSARARQYLAAALVTAITVVVGGGVILTTTSLGCGPAKALGLKSIGSRCTQPVASRTPQPSESPLSSPTATSSAAPSPSPSRIPSPSPAPSGSIPDTGPASAAYPPMTAPASGANGQLAPGYPLDCRLPVYVGPPGSGGFIVFPGDTFIPDPSSGVVLPALPAGQPAPSPFSGQYGYGPPPSPAYTYDPQAAKWLPVPYAQMAPDGSRYAFTNVNGIWVVDVASGALSEIGSGESWVVLSVQTAGVYATQSGRPGLWLVPYTGEPHQITAGGYWQVASAGAAYGTPSSAVPAGVVNPVLHADLHTGAVVTWFTRDGATLNVVGVGPSGEAIVNVQYLSAGVNETWLVGSPGKGYPINPATAGGSVNLNSQPFSNASGVWFAAGWAWQYGGGVSGLVLFVPGKEWYWMSSYNVMPAGACFRP